jgi:rhodanese-related sulfurtransferase
MSKRPAVPEVTPLQLAAELASESPPLLIDVREPHELQISRLEGALNIPMDDVLSAVHRLDPAAPIVVVCRSGNRSAFVTQTLLKLGFRSVRNLSTGMNGWSRDVDPNVRTY